MQLNVSGIRVTGGEWRVLSPEDTGMNPPDQKENALLVVAATFGLMDKNGVAIAQGQISNSPSTGDNVLELSPATLESFQAFFSNLEHDIANSLEAKDPDDKRSALASILAGNIPK